MTEVTLRLDSAAALLYRRIAEAQGISLEQVLSDALFKLAGELSLQALQADKWSFLRPEAEVENWELKVESNCISYGNEFNKCAKRTP